MKEIPTKEQVQAQLDAINAEKPGMPRQLVVSDPIRYKRGSGTTTRIWINLCCSEHGNYPVEIRLDQILKTGTSCKRCGHKRTGISSRRTYTQIENAVNKWATERGFPIRLMKVSDDYKTVDLECRLHGIKVRNTGKVVDRGQLCDECVDQSGVNSPVYVPFAEKIALYKARYNPPLVELVREGAGTIWYKCLVCQKEYEGNWSNIYSSGIRSCKPCSAKSRIFTNLPSGKEIISADDIQVRLAEFGINIVDKELYKGTHYYSDFQCKRCLTIKHTTANHIFTRRGMSCTCTRSIPYLCHDLISNHLILAGHDVCTEYKLKDKKTFADIYLRDLSTIVEVKFGDSPFGRPQGQGQVESRFLHTKDQLDRYIASGYKIIYAVIAYEDNIEYLMQFPEHVDIVFLRGRHEFKDHSLLGNIEMIEKLREFYLRPYTVRNSQGVESLDREKIRNSLKEYLKTNNFIYPTQKIIPERFGFSQRKLDAALGVGRHPSMQERLKACRHWFGFDTFSEKSAYVSSDPDNTFAIKLLEELRKYLVDNNGIYPSNVDSTNQFGVYNSALDNLLGVTGNDMRRRRCKELFDIDVVFKSELYLHRTPEAQIVRQSLKAYLLNNDYCFPKRRQIKDLFDVGWNALDAYLGLEKPVDQQMRIGACKRWFDLTVK